MTPKDWQDIDQKNPVTVPAKPAKGLWTLARSRVAQPQILRITAEGKWTPIAGLGPCGPDGFRRWPFSRDQLIVKNAPFGALIAKVGGSDSSFETDNTFVIGSVAELALDKISGPLFFTINDVPGFYDDNSGEVEVTIG